MPVMNAYVRLFVALFVLPPIQIAEQ